MEEGDEEVGRMEGLTLGWLTVHVKWLTISLPVCSGAG